MQALEDTNRRYLEAAQGWLELGDSAEAKAELEKIAPQLQTHPEVLKVRWEICAAERQWEAALEIAATLIQTEPEHPLGWIHRSYALHELKRTAEARDNLLRVVDQFPISATIRYNLACYECQLGRLAEAKVWLQIAFRLGTASKMRQVALQDEDLKPLWKDISSVF